NRARRRVRPVAGGFGFELYELCRSVALEPVIAGAPDDLQQPALGIPLSIAVEIAKRPQARLLHDIGGIGLVSRQPPRERIAGVEMGQHHRLEPAASTPSRDPRHALFYPAREETAAIATLFRAVAIALPTRHTLSAKQRISPMDMTGEFRIPAPRQRVWE